MAGGVATGGLDSAAVEVRAGTSIGPGGAGADPGDAGVGLGDAGVAAGPRRLVMRALARPMRAFSRAALTRRTTLGRGGVVRSCFNEIRFVGPCRGAAAESAVAVAPVRASTKARLSKRRDRRRFLIALLRYPGCAFANLVKILHRAEVFAGIGIQPRYCCIASRAVE